ncbi:helix-turn-helix domain-containing protein [Streptomyces sp. WZ.A104]|uniref:helix-turn-helix domain-containing protein n=1 Tax=Streptomyces sp. WZ.A104 TaxID=2023771 RepID=UPI00211BF5B3|nr:helix-turn-helix domain-containing protein [Streptomyces sp. WZ.A104]
MVAPAVPPSSPSAVRPRASIRALAEETSRSYGGVHRLLDGAGTTFRSRSGVPRRPES